MTALLGTGIHRIAEGVTNDGDGFWAYIPPPASDGKQRVYLISKVSGTVETLRFGDWGRFKATLKEKPVMRVRGTINET